MRNVGENPWDEFGTTTGRPRRCGWLDAVVLRFAARLNGLTELVLNKLDVLSGIGPLQVATRYRGPEGAEFDSFPYHQSILHKATAVYEAVPGWDEPLIAIALNQYVDEIWHDREQQ